MRTMKQLLSKFVVICALMLGTGAASCAASPSHSVQDTIQTSTLADLVFINIENYRSGAIHVTAVYNGREVILGDIEAEKSEEYTLDIADGATGMQMLVKFSDGYECITFSIWAVPGDLLTLRLTPGYISEQFCAPTVAGSRDRRA